MILSPPVLGAARQIGWWALGRRRRFRVIGPSMEPTLHHGEFVLVDTATRPDPGDLVLGRHPVEADLLVVKRLVDIVDDGRYVVVSDNPGAGSDSRHWGPLDPGLVLGRVTLVLDRPLARLDQPSGSPVPGRAATRGAVRTLGRWLRR